MYIYSQTSESSVYTMSCILVLVCACRALLGFGCQFRFNILVMSFQLQRFVAEGQPKIHIRYGEQVCSLFQNLQ